MTSSPKSGLRPLRHSTASIREALSYVASSGMPAQHKSVLMDVIERALAMSDPDPLPIAAPMNDPWQTQELQLIASNLDGKTAISWQNADELLVPIAKQLNRSLDEVKAKATELGFGAAVDFGIAKAANK